MKKSAIIAIIITMVVVSPAIVGYALPSGEVEETTYKADNFINITNQISTESIPIYADYKGPDNNSYWKIGASNNYEQLSPVRQDLAQSPYPNLGSPKLTELTVSNDYVPIVEDGYYCTIYQTSGLGEFVDSTGFNRFDIVKIYSNGRVDGYQPNMVVMKDIGSVKYRSPVPHVISQLSYKISSYTDPAWGWYAPVTEDHKFYWSNLHQNGSVDIMIKCPHYNLGDLTFWFIPKDYSSETMGMPPSVTISKNNGFWEVFSEEIPDCGHGPVTLGSSGAYTMILIRADFKNHLLSVSGLIGVNSFTDPSYPSKIGKTVSGPIYEGFRDISQIAFDSCDDARNAHLAIVNAEIPNGRAMGIRDAYVEPTNWIGVDEDWLMTLNGLAVTGHEFGLFSRGVGTDYDVIDGCITVGGKTYKMAGLEILNIHTGDKAGLYLNKDRIRDPIDSIHFNGNWMTQVLVSEVDTIHETKFVWSEGSFNLDYDGFCKVGLIASAASFIVTGLIGRRDGGNAAIAAVASAICGLVYIILLMH